MAEADLLASLDPQMAYEQLFGQMLRNLPASLRETLMAGALPHFLDDGLAAVLFPADPQASLVQVASFPSTSRNADGQLQYHAQTRSIFLSSWQQEDLQRFRQLNGLLADEFMRRLESTRGDTMEIAMEWVYHSVAANPDAGMYAMANLFHELLETRELGTAERLLRLVGELLPWLGDQAVWLENFQAALAAYRNQPVDDKVLEALANKKPGSMLAACTRRLQGRLAVQNQQWAAGRKYLLEALAIFEREKSPGEQALTHLELGNRFYLQVTSSGGVRAESRTLGDWLSKLLYIISRLPLLLYRWLAERLNFLPNFYGSSYQNWVALFLLRAAGNHYQAAGRLFAMLGNERGKLETDFYMGRILLLLGHFDSAARRCEKALQSPLALASPYYTARLNLIIAQAHLQHGRLEEARRLLESCLETFTRYADWRLTLDSALVLGTVLEKQADWPALVECTARGLEAACRAPDPLAETRLASRLEWYAEMPGPGPSERQAARDLRETVISLAFIDRFPGSVRQTFHLLSNWLAFPFAFLFGVTLILASGFLMQFIEGELRVQPDPVQWSQAWDLIVRLALPFLMLWGYHIFYILLGQAVALALSFSKVDEEQPETWRVDVTGLTRVAKPGEKHETLPWESLRRLVVHNRFLYSLPMVFSSRMYLVPSNGEGSRPIELPASIFRYSALQEELEKRLAGRVFKVELSLLNTRWLWISLLVGFAIALAGGLGLFGEPWHGCYNDPLVTGPQDVCRPEFRVYIQPIVQAGLLFASLLFGAITWVRWQVANRKVRRALEKTVEK